MANNYLQFSEVINNITPEETEWARTRLKEMTDKFSDSCGDEGWYFEWAVHDAHDPTQGPHVWVYAEEGGEPEHVAEFFQEFLKKFRPDECLSLTWASFCSKLRVGEFGGGGFFVTAKKAYWYNPYDDIDHETKKFKMIQEEAKKMAKKDGKKK